MAATKSHPLKELSYYMGLPYTFVLHPAPEGGFAIEVAELRGCISQGDTSEEAMMRIREAMALWIEGAIEDDHPIPEPGEGESSEFSGKFVTRVPKGVHKALVGAAKREGVSLNLFVATTLATAIGERA
jgi:antitoxin HicB